MNSAKPDQPLPVGITMGDAAGIGPEIIVKLAASELPHPAVIYGDVAVLNKAAASCGLSDKIHIVPLAHAADALELPENTLGVVNRWEPFTAVPPPGQIDTRAGRAAYEYLCHAIDDALAGKLHAIVTAPLNKEAMHKAGIEQPGHTEILAQRSKAPHVAMVMVNNELRVTLATIHIPLAEVPTALSIDGQLTTIRLAHQACLQAGVSKPRIAVAGLNPHAGENGQFGTEEQTIIAPAIDIAQQEGIKVSGPWPGDTVFMQARQGKFDMVVAQYHDQGLIPVKYLGLDDGVNMTAGLPFVRTSVDHGTAFDIAGQGIADEHSLRTAFELAVQMTNP